MWSRPHRIARATWSGWRAFFARHLRLNVSAPLRLVEEEEVS